MLHPEQGLCLTNFAHLPLGIPGVRVSREQFERNRLLFRDPSYRGPVHDTEAARADRIIWIEVEPFCEQYIRLGDDLSLSARQRLAKRLIHEFRVIREGGVIRVRRGGFAYIVENLALRPREIYERRFFKFLVADLSQ